MWASWIDLNLRSMLFQDCDSYDVCFSPMPVEVFIQEKESQTPCPKCGRLRKTQGFYTPPWVLYWNVSPLLALTCPLGCSPANSHTPGAPGSAPQAAAETAVSIRKKKALITRDLVFNLWAKIEVIKTPCQETRMASKKYGVSTLSNIKRGEEHSPNSNTHLGLVHGLGYTIKNYCIVLTFISVKVRDTFPPNSLASISTAIKP